MMESGMTIDDFDAMTDDDFTDFVYARRRPDFAVGNGQRMAMVRAHESWIASMDEDDRDSVDWNTETHSDWDLYAELRMNGVDFDRVTLLEAMPAL
jgi:hypothetical protein